MATPFFNFSWCWLDLWVLVATEILEPCTFGTRRKLTLWQNSCDCLYRNYTCANHDSSNSDTSADLSFAWIARLKGVGQW